MTLRRALMPTLALVTALALAGCSDDSGDGETTPTTSPSATETESPSETPSESPSESPAADGLVLDVTVAGDTVTPSAKAVDAKAGEKITLHVTSDRDGELHVHSTPEHEFEFKAGTSDFDFTIDNPGSIDIEEHVSEALVYRVLVK